MKCYTSVATATEERLTERPWALVTRSLPGIPLDRFARAAASVLGCHEGDEGYEYGHRQHAGGRLPVAAGKGASPLGVPTVELYLRAARKYTRYMYNDDPLK